MTTNKLLSAVLFTAVMLATPAIAREHVCGTRPMSERTDANAPFCEPYSHTLRVPAPSVGESAAEPTPGGICDWGDNPMIC
jgi:hypothetical protein